MSPTAFLLFISLVPLSLCSASTPRLDGYTLASVTLQNGGEVAFVKDLAWRLSRPGYSNVDLRLDGRDEWSVYLKDDSTSDNYQVDYHVGSVFHNNAVLDNIVSATIGSVNGRNVGLVAFSSGPFGSGEFVETGHRAWVWRESNGNETPLTYYGRDEWSVYLDCATQRVQLDLHHKIVVVEDHANTRMDVMFITTSDFRRINYRGEILRMVQPSTWKEPVAAPALSS